MFEKNEYKFSVLRNFGTEQVSITATVYSFSTNIAKLSKSVVSGLQKAVYDFYVQTDKRADEEIAYTKDKFKDNPEVLRQINKNINNKK